MVGARRRQYASSTGMRKPGAWQAQGFSGEGNGAELLLLW
jgi:hypothetical protein